MSRELAHVWPGTGDADVGGLTGVEYVLQYGEPNYTAAITLRFAGATLMVRPHPDDSCSFSPAPPELQPFEEVVPVGDRAPVWKPLLGRRCAGIWSIVDTDGRSASASGLPAGPGRSPSSNWN